MAADFNADSIGFSSDLSVQANRLSAYLIDRYPKATPMVAMMAAFGLAPDPGVDLKVVARKLAAALLSHGIQVKHTHALEAASQMAFGKPWMALRLIEEKRLKLVPMQQQFEESRWASWREMGLELARVCDSWQKSAPNARWFRLLYLDDMLVLSAPVPPTDEEIDSYPVAMITPIEPTSDWLEGICDATEHLRRMLEESRSAVLEGVCVLEACDRRTSVAPKGPDDLRMGDAPNTELVLRSETSIDQAHLGFDIVRGDELHCWHEFDKAIADRGPHEILIDEDGAWCYGDDRFVWYVQTLPSQELVPGLRQSNLAPSLSRRLLHRYRVARQIFKGNIPDTSSKRLNTLSKPAERYEIDQHQVLLQLSKANLSWEQFCAGINQPDLDLEPRLPVGVIYSLVTALNLPNPDVVFARPSRSQLIRTEAHHLQALMPRLDHVRYRIDTPIAEEDREVIREAIADFGTAMQMRKGALKTDLPELVFGNDAADLLGRLETLGLCAYMGVTPHLARIPDAHLPTPDTWKYAFGHSLYLAIDRAT